ncbi:MAG: hypothetical protein HYU66_14515 [Armatimonadetes bacterium]|nr:hypothetical protein [Armatimonadota bacterium]
MGRRELRLPQLEGWLAVALLWLPRLGAAEIDLEWHPSALGIVSVRTTGLEPPGSEGGAFLRAEERLWLDATARASTMDASAHLRAELVHDSIAGTLAFDWREAFADVASGPWDFRMGRQVVTWGVGDLLFINDVFPKDWGAFFSGSPAEYLKRAVDAVRIGFSSNAVNADLLVIPFFSPDRLPSRRRFWQFDPTGGAPLPTVHPATGLANTETALRLYGQAGRFDLAGYAYRGFHHTPGARPGGAGATMFYPHLSVFGLSAQGPAWDGILSLEAGYYDSRDDEDGDDPGVPNSSWRFLTGYQIAPRDDLQLGVQYYGERMEDHGAYRRTVPAGMPSAPAYRDLLTFRVTRLHYQHTLRLSSFLAYGPVEGDLLWQPSASYAISDHLTIAGGANVFGGHNGPTFFGQFDRDDNVYSWIRYDW